MLVASFTNVVRHARGSLIRSMSSVPEVMKVRPILTKNFGRVMASCVTIRTANHATSGNEPLWKCPSALLKVRLLILASQC